MHRFKFIIVFLFALICNPLCSQIRLPKLISDGSILQRDLPLNIWGWAAPNERVALTFKKDKYTTHADSNGNWRIVLPAQPSGGPFVMEFQASNSIILNDILFGDVWVCSGQSNMELPMERVKEKYQNMIRNSSNANIRQFLIPDAYDFKTPHEDVDDGKWVSANPENILDFSAVAYFFAIELYEKYKIPIGIINTAVGGSPIEAWMSEASLMKYPEAYRELIKFKDDKLINSIEEADKKRSDDWYKSLDHNDQGLQSTLTWSEINLEDKNWETMTIPGYWADGSLGLVNGVVWFRKEIEVPKSMVGKPASLWLGRIVDQDFAYINGELVGTTGYQYPPRRYPLTSSVLKEGLNTITVRVVNNSGRGGFVSDKPYFLAVENDTIDLKGGWKYKLGTSSKPLEDPTFIRWKPGGLYNKMIAPLLNYNIKGALWYQGESNTAKPFGYHDKLSSMINDWRDRWNQGDFPFVLVQLANFMEESNVPEESSWAVLRQEQLETLSVTNNTGMAVTIDIGEWNDIHPLNKMDVGVRLALEAQKLAYHENDDSLANPFPKRSVFDKKKVTISFNNTGNGLKARDNADLRYFTISNDGINFIWAQAKIKNNRIIVWNDKISNPTVVRYAWANNPHAANLVTMSNLPVTPFEVSKETSNK